MFCAYLKAGISLPQGRGFGLNLGGCAPAFVWADLTFLEQWDALSALVEGLNQRNTESHSANWVLLMSCGVKHPHALLVPQLLGNPRKSTQDFSPYTEHFC